MKAQYETNLVCRAMDEDGDMRFGEGQNGQLHTLDAMKQVLKTRLGAVAGEWWEGDEGAIPYFDGNVLGAIANDKTKDAIDLLVINRIMDTVGVTGVSNVESSIENRRYHFTCSVQTVYGTTTAEVSL